MDDSPTKSQTESQPQPKPQSQLQTAPTFKEVCEQISDFLLSLDLPVRTTLFYLCVGQWLGDRIISGECGGGTIFNAHPQGELWHVFVLHEAMLRMRSKHEPLP
jgi:hypothetical protein